MPRSALDLLRAALVGTNEPPVKKDDWVKRKPTNLPLTQLEPWADSIQVAMGARPWSVRYQQPEPIFLPDGRLAYRVGRYTPENRRIYVSPDVPANEFQHRYAHEVAHAAQDRPAEVVSAEFDRQYAGVPRHPGGAVTIGSDTTTPRSLWRSVQTLIAEAKLRDVYKKTEPYWTPNPVAQMPRGTGRFDERNAETAALAWRKWSGREKTQPLPKSGAPYREKINVEDIEKIARLLEQNYNTRKKGK